MHPTVLMHSSLQSSNDLSSKDSKSFPASIKLTIFFVFNNAVRTHCIWKQRTWEKEHSHTASFWNITVQWTSHDDLTEKICRHFFPFYIDCFNQKTCEMTKIQNCTLQFDEKCFRRILSVDWDFGANLQINLEVKCMDRSSWKKESIISVFILFVTG